MYNLFMTNTLISSQLGDPDRSTAMSNSGVTNARRRNGSFAASRFFRKKS